jgi:hypothetical protein
MAKNGSFASLGCALACGAQTIPIEDFVYGYGLFLWNIYFFQLLNKQKIIDNK